MPIFEYFEKQWLYNKFLLPGHWCHSGHHDRTNNVSEAFHSGMRRHNLPTNSKFYKLISLLKAETDLISLKLKHVCEVSRIHRTVDDQRFERNVVTLNNALHAKKISSFDFLDLLTRLKMVTQIFLYCDDSRASLFEEDVYICIEDEFLLEKVDEKNEYINKI